MARWKIGVFISLTVSVLLVSACTTIDSTEAITPGDNVMEDSVQTLTMEDNMKTITVKAGEIVIIRLEGNITTGYTWEVEKIDNMFIQQVGETDYFEVENSEVTPQKENLTGAAGEFIFTFEALQVGETSLRLVYHRTFETGVEPLDVFTITVQITA